MREVVENKDAHVAADKIYFPCYVIDEEGKESPALFTKEQIKIVTDRAESNTEDIPARKYHGSAFVYVSIALAVTILWFLTQS